MNTYTLVKNRLLILCEEKNMSIHKLAIESAIPPIDDKEHSLWKKQKPRNCYFKNAL